MQLLGQRLDRDGRVEFKNGSTIIVEHETDLRVTWPGTTETAYVNQWAHDQLGRAYDLALAGAPEPEPEVRPPARIRPPKGDGSKFGSCPF